MSRARRRKVVAWGALLVLSGAGCTGAAASPTNDGGLDATSSGSPPDGSVTDASQAPDAGSPDTGVSDGATGLDGGTGNEDGSVIDGDTCDAPGQCGPGVVTSAPTFVPPERTQEGVCTPQQIDEFFNACLSSSATSYACNAWYNDPDAGAANQACYGCMLTDSLSGAWGPLVFFDQEQQLDFNYGGCIAVLDPPNASCGQAVELDQECDYAACSQCLVVDSTTAQNLYQCIATADSVPCACETYAQAARCAAAEVDAGPASACLSGDLTTFYYATVPVFCGSASDAGASDGGGD